MKKLLLLLPLLAACSPRARVAPAVASAPPESAAAPEATVPAPVPVTAPEPPRQRPVPAVRVVELPRARPEQVGMNPSVLTRVDSIIEAALADGAAPGAAVAIGRHGRIIKMQGYGKHDYRAGFGLVTDSSIYDLASLTKVVATTTAAMVLYERGLLDLDAPLSNYLPELHQYPDKARFTARNVLLHNTGMRAYAPLWRVARGATEYLHRIGELPLEYPTGAATVYSDFGPILLALAIQRITGEPFDEWVRANIFAPLGMRETMFNPLQQAIVNSGTGAASESMALLSRIAPTEIDREFRRQHMHGRVHDENAFAIGGISGHAGLFSSARDLALFAQMLLNGGQLNGRQILRPETIAYFTRRQGTNSSRALGWDTPAKGSSAGDYFSDVAFGHTGFTGTSMWLDPRTQTFVILLTNRVNPTRENQKHIPLRRALSDAVNRSIVDMPVPQRSW